MKFRIIVALLGLALPVLRAVPSDWTTSLNPFRISGNLYYVGSRDLAAFLVVTAKGNILINANLESSPPLIRRSVEKLGFQWSETKILLSSQAHYDHAAGAAEVVRETHAQYMVMDGDVDVIESGGATDFDQSLPHFPRAHVNRILHDKDVVALGNTSIVAHRTGGHTRGCTTWTMITHEGGKSWNVVIVGGWAANPGVRLRAGQNKPESYPGIANDFEHTFTVLAALPCDVFLGAHGSYFDMLTKLSRMPEQGSAVWIDPDGYRRAVSQHAATFRQSISIASR